MAWCRSQGVQGSCFHSRVLETRPALGGGLADLGPQVWGSLCQRAGALTLNPYTPDTLILHL